MEERLNVGGSFCALRAAQETARTTAKRNFRTPGLLRSNFRPAVCGTMSVADHEFESLFRPLLLPDKISKCDEKTGLCLDASVAKPLGGVMNIEATSDRVTGF